MLNVLEQINKCIKMITLENYALGVWDFSILVFNMKCGNVWLFDNFCLFNCEVSVEELEQSISVKIAKEAVMNINKPESLLSPPMGF